MIIFEDISNIEKISKYQRANETIVSFSTIGKLALNKKGIKSYYPDELVKLPDLNKIGIDNIDRAQNICSFLDEAFRKKFIFLKENNMNLLSSGYFFIKVFFDMLHTSYFILEELFRDTDEEIIIFKKRFYLDKLVKDQEQIGLDPIVPAIVENVFLKNRNKIKFIPGSNFALRRSLLLSLKGVAKSVYNLFLNENNSKRFHANGIVLVYTHDIPYLANDILKDVNFFKLYLNKDSISLRSLFSSNFGIKIRTKKNKIYDNLIIETFKEALETKEYRNMFINNDNLFYFANKVLQYYMLVTIGRILPYADLIKDSLVDLAPKMLLTSACRLDLTDAFLLELAKSLKVPVITYQEGGGGGYLNWPLFNGDMNLSDYFLVYGEGVKESPFLAGRAKVISVGSLRLSNIKRKIKVKTLSQITIYVILDLFKMSTWQHYPYSGGFFSQAYSHQLKILDALRRFKEVKFVIKTIKGREFLYKPFIDKNFVRIVTKPLIDVLCDASAFILEYPSTVLMECLLTDKPIALLCNKDSVSFDAGALYLLSKRIRICSDPKEFKEAIMLLIEDIKNQTPMVYENGFLKKYCLMDNNKGMLNEFFSNLIDRKENRDFDKAGDLVLLKINRK